MGKTSEPEKEDLAAKHLAFKLEAAKVLHGAANRRHLCGDFDYVLEQVGLPGRDNYYGTWHKHPKISGEDTAEAFEAWRLQTSRRLYLQARSYGLERQTHNYILREAGFHGYDELFKTVKAKIEGTFVLHMDVEVAIGDDLIDHINPNDVQQGVYRSFGTEAVHWKAVVASDNAVDDNNNNNNESEIDV